jgi:predicted RNA binding protein YcfA (HicA-like mRNA interferase family)
VSLVHVPKKYREVKKILLRAGWTHARTKGSHEIWIHPSGGRTVLAPGSKENREVPAHTLSKIRRATGIEELR